ncbi:MAG: hypothetical protein JST81_07720 [Bacteroidetes bacterium]|nr:hypothetical protein [Bacteroidota bacterium]
MKNKRGEQRFEFYLVKLEEQLLLSAKELNPALWLYNNNARTTLFMLEGLSKLYAGVHNRKRFEKLKEHFKLLEDALGAVDYYDSFGKEFSANTTIPVTITEYVQGQSREKIQRLNDILISNKWIGENAVRIKKARKKIEMADWLEPKEELKAIFNFYKSSIAELKEFMLEHAKGFTEIESQVHDIRRKLRWLSIYPQALQGVIQLNSSSIVNGQTQKYLTTEIVNSPFNQMPAPGDNPYFLLLEKNYFLALSWMIAELGKLKDNGLRILVIVEALEQTEKLTKEEATAKALNLLNYDNNMPDKILADASAVCKTFFAENNLDKLIYGITSK